MNILKKIWEGFKKGWMKFAHTVGKVNSTILLSILYFVVVGVYSIISRFLKLLIWPFRKKPQTYWVSREKTLDPQSHKYPF